MEEFSEYPFFLKRENMKFKYLIHLQLNQIFTQPGFKQRYLTSDVDPDLNPDPDSFGSVDPDPDPEV